jgi:hypothetical protein
VAFFLTDLIQNYYKTANRTAFAKYFIKRIQLHQKSCSTREIKALLKKSQSHAKLATGVGSRRQHVWW